MADPRVELLRKVPLFGSCTDQQLRFIASRVEDVDVPAGRELCREGESGGEFFVLVSGAAEVKRGGRTVDRLGAGDFFGEISLLDHRPRSATVTTAEPSRVLALSHTQFRDVLHQEAGIAVTILYAVVERLRAASAPPRD
ncbi:MAG TPA: cyclic nucleotide-binding domain-containing protein [Candidatus Limnocylindria bacterium]|nr:cyclic nucleotide-binding domain-containing protein [Candidatus Limnocylindria bacterium]